MAYNREAYQKDLSRVPRKLTKHPRTVRSFVRREGRLTAGQHHALETFMPVYGLTADSDVFNFAEIFGRNAPVVLEIGFGNGDSLLSLAESNPDTNFLGIEVHRPGVGHLLKGIHDKQLTNLKVVNEDAAIVLKTNIPDASLSKILLLFPDPWPKKRHHKRRFIQPASVKILSDKLEPDGILHLATDWQDYAEHMYDVLQVSDLFDNLAGPEIYHKRPDYRTPTRFEQRGLRLGHRVFDLLFSRLS